MILKKPSNSDEIRCILIDSMTIPGAYRILGESNEAVGLLSAEFGIVILSGLFSNEAVPCALQSGESIRVIRSTTGHMILDNKRMTISGATNMRTFLDEFCPNGGDNKSVTTGLIPRIGLAVAHNMAGTRLHKPAPDHTPYCDMHYETMLSLLGASKDYYFNSNIERNVLRLSDEAMVLLRNMLVHFETSMGPGGKYEMHKEHASRLVEQVCRVGACFHCYEGFEGNISKETIMTAYKVCMYYSECYMYFFNLPPQAEMDADSLDKWFDLHYRNLGKHFVLKNDARQLCRFKLRKNGRFYAALAHLVKTNKVSIYVEKNKEWIGLNPSSSYTSASSNGQSVLLRSTGFFD